MIKVLLFSKQIVQCTALFFNVLSTTSVFHNNILRDIIIPSISDLAFSNTCDICLFIRCRLPLQTSRRCDGSSWRLRSWTRRSPTLLKFLVFGENGGQPFVHTSNKRRESPSLNPVSTHPCALNNCIRRIMNLFGFL